jgi:acetyl-CoA acyltransferase
MNDVYLCDGIRTPIGRYGGALAGLRTDDLAAIPLKALVARNPAVDWAALDDVYYGCANQAGEDNRNVARMALLLAGLPDSIPAATVNRLCGSSMDAVAICARAIRAGETELMVAGGVEGMTRAPFVMPKADSAYSRAGAIFDTTLGWRFINPVFRQQFGVDSMPETAENVAAEFGVARTDQDAFALRSQRRYAAAMSRGYFAEEIVPVTIPGPKGDTIVAEDEHPRATTPDALARLKGVVRPDGTVTAGNASGINDGAVATLIANDRAAARYGLRPIVRIVGSATVGVPPRIMGIGPAPATRKLLERHKLKVTDVQVFEINEAFAAQALAVTRQLGLADDASHVNPNGGAIAIGHPLGASGARIVLTAARQLVATGGRYAVATMCIGVGQGIALLVERV